MIISFRETYIDGAKSILDRLITSVTDMDVNASRGELENSRDRFGPYLEQASNL